MQPIQLRTCTVPVAVLQRFLVEPGVAEQLAKAAFEAPGVAVPYGQADSLENPPLRVEWFVYSDHVRIDWRKHGYQEFPVRGYLHETEQPLKPSNLTELAEYELGTRIVASDLPSGTHPEPIAPGKRFFFSFFVPCPVDRVPWFLKWAVSGIPVEPEGWVSFSVFLPSAQVRLEELLELAHLDEQLRRKVESRQSPAVKRKQKVDDVLERTKDFKVLQERCFMQKQQERRQIDQLNLSERERKQRISSVETTHGRLMEELQRVFFK